MAAPPLPQAQAGGRRHLAAMVHMTILAMIFFSNMILAQHVVENLPGFPGKLPFRLETGYIGVGEKEEVQLFYYFIESEGNPEDDPLLLWLTGGPGCSGLSGLVYEIGPFTIDAANSNGSIPALTLNKHSWTKVANVIFVDQPVGTGFSYANTSEASYSNDTLSAKFTYDFLRKCLEKICPAQILEPSCGKLWRKKSDLLSWRTPSSEENPVNFLQPVAPLTESGCRDTSYLFSHTWANNKLVQRALHIREETITEWVRCNHSIQNNEVGPYGTTPYTYNVESTIHYHQDFTHKSCRALIYSGDHDMLISHTSTKKWIDSTELSIKSDWRPWIVGGQIAGYTMTYEQGDYELTFATVKGAGHTAPEYKPVECYAMINKWLGQTSL